MRLFGDPPRIFERPHHLYDGMRIRFEGEKQRYTIQATSERFTVCTKPFNAQKTVLYTIIDWKEQRRGTENTIFGIGAEDRIQCLEMLVRLMDGETEVSARNTAWLNIETIDHDEYLIADYRGGKTYFPKVLDKVKL